VGSGSEKACLIGPGLIGIVINITSLQLFEVDETIVRCLLLRLL